MQDLIDEQLKIYGLEVYYIPRQIYEDRAWHDIYYSEFKDSYLIEMYLENFDGFAGKGDLMSKFGLQVTDEITLTVSRRRWQDFAEMATNKIVDGRPNDGDLIFFPLNKMVFEIKYVENQVPFYQLNHLYVYTITCELFQYGDSIFDTGIPDIDNLEQESGVYPLTLASGGTGNFKLNEVITGLTSGHTAKLVSWDRAARIVEVAYSNGDFNTGEIIKGQDSNAQWTVSGFSTIDLLDAYAENKNIEEAADDVIDFSEKNPFGTYGNIRGSF